MKYSIMPALFMLCLISTAEAGSITFGFYYTYSAKEISSEFNGQTGLKTFIDSSVKDIEKNLGIKISVKFIEKFPFNTLYTDIATNTRGVVVNDFFEKHVPKIKPDKNINFIFVLTKNIWDIDTNYRPTGPYDSKAGNAGSEDNKFIALVAYPLLKYQHLFVSNLMHEWGHLLGLPDIREGCNTIQFIMCGWTNDKPVMIEKSFKDAVKALP